MNSIVLRGISRLARIAALRVAASQTGRLAVGAGLEADMGVDRHMHTVAATKPVDLVGFTYYLFSQNDRFFFY